MFDGDNPIARNEPGPHWPKVDQGNQRKCEPDNYHSMPVRWKRHPRPKNQGDRTNCKGNTFHLRHLMFNPP
jgi:hypothetical protein